MRISAYLMVWPDKGHDPSVCAVKDLKHFQNNYPEAVFVPLFTATQIGEAIMGVKS